MNTTIGVIRTLGLTRKEKYFPTIRLYLVGGQVRIDGS